MQIRVVGAWLVLAAVSSILWLAIFHTPGAQLNFPALSAASATLALAVAMVAAASYTRWSAVYLFAWLPVAILGARDLLYSDALGLVGAIAWLFLTGFGVGLLLTVAYWSRRALMHVRR